MHMLSNVDILMHFISSYPFPFFFINAHGQNLCGTSLYYEYCSITWGPLRERCGQGQLFNLCLQNSKSTWRTRSKCLTNMLIRNKKGNKQDELMTLFNWSSNEKHVCWSYILTAYMLNPSKSFQWMTQAGLHNLAHICRPTKYCKN